MGLNHYLLIGLCVHYFESKERGLVCKHCGYTLPLVKIKGKTSAANGHSFPVQI